jgi:hypothetical protein
MTFRMSNRLEGAIRCGRTAARPGRRTKQYLIAIQANLHPSSLSRLLSGELVRMNDPRVLRLATLFDVPAAEAFEPASGDDARERPAAEPRA